MVKIDNEFKMNWAHAADVERERDPSSQGPHNDSACGKQHVGVVCLVPACSGARVYQRTKVEKTPLVVRQTTAKRRLES